MARDGLRPPPHGPHNPAVSDSGLSLRHLGAALAALAATLLVVGAWSSWWSGGQEGMTFSAGLRFVEMCGGGECRDAPLATLGSAGWMRVGIGAFSAAFVGAALLFASIGRVLAAPEARSVLPGAAAIACVTAAMLGVAFALLAPDEITALSLRAPVVLYFAGAALGAGSAAALLPVRKPDR